MTPPIKELELTRWSFLHTTLAMPHKKILLQSGVLMLTLTKLTKSQSAD